MKVELTIEQAEALCFAANLHRGIPAVADAGLALALAVLQAENSPDEDHPDDEARADG